MMKLPGFHAFRPPLLLQVPPVPNSLAVTPPPGKLEPRRPISSVAVTKVRTPPFTPPPIQPHPTCIFCIYPSCYMEESWVFSPVNGESNPGPERMCLPQCLLFARCLAGVISILGRQETSFAAPQRRGVQPCPCAL